MTAEVQEAVKTRGISVKLTEDDIAWLDQRKSKTAESRSVILRSVLRGVRERESAEASA